MGRPGTADTTPSKPPGDSTAEGAGKARPRRRTHSGRRLFAFDRALGCRFVAGADEAGRGSLAGPLVAAAVLFDLERLTLSDRRALSRLNDSKQHTADTREELYPLVLRAAARSVIVSRCVGVIDSRGLHNTNLEALRTALLSVARKGAVCLVDGFRLGPTAPPHHAVVDGDEKSAAIAAASIVAKVTRDRLMRRMDALFPHYGFSSHVGYITPGHSAIVRERGPSTIHRRSGHARSRRGRCPNARRCP